MAEPLIGRRHWALGVASLAAAMVVDACVIEPAWLDVTEHEIPVEHLPASLEGFTIAHLTDMHLGSLGKLEESIIEEIQARSVGLVVITGDSIDREARLETMTELCANLRARGRMLVATWGNWEHWSQINPESLRAHYSRAGVRLAQNESLTVGGGSGWYRTRLGRAYVSRGIGTSIVAARLGCRPELALFQLRRG